MRKELQTVLEDYLNRFPHNLAQVRRARRSSSSIATQEVVDLTEEQLRDCHWTGRRSEIYAIFLWRGSFFNGAWNRG
jgi:hypothetical protein